ncbi:hypothetical protein ACIBQX_18625 [Nonomuraea sp. NPDC049714]|uniref:hypothetical protein n=1 Tax=Nonomuraea sp. NPDC049714 TaxID=3364357 RepID=UPI0037B3E73F
MSNFLTGAIVLLFFVLLSLRPVTSDARTTSDYRERARRAGWAGCLLGTLRIAIVAALLVLVYACRICWHAAAAVGSALTLAAVVVEAMTSPSAIHMEAS